MQSRNRNKLRSSLPLLFMTAVRILPLALLSAGLTGCMETMPPVEFSMTAAELSAYSSESTGQVLVGYLGQTNAIPIVCDINAQGPPVQPLSPEARAALVHALAASEIAPEMWRRCISTMLHREPGPGAAALIDAIAREYRALLVRSNFEKSTALQERIGTMQRLYIERDNSATGTPKVQQALFNDLRHALASHRLGPVATRLGQQLLEIFDLEHGVWTGRRVDVTMLDSLFGAKDEKTLKQFADRLPSSALREEARRRVIRLHIAASPYPEVREHAAHAEEIVMKQGIYPLDLAVHPPVRGWLDASQIPVRGVLVRQDVWNRTAQLLAYSGARPDLSVLPEVKLRRVLLMDVAGISRPVTLCGPAKSLDPTPCVVAGYVKIENSTAYLDHRGRFRFIDSIRMQDAVGLARHSGPFTLPVSVAGKQLLSLSWPLSFEKPADLIFTALERGASGPNLSVRVERPAKQTRLIFAVSGPGNYWAVVEGQDASSFKVESRGLKGADGADGADGYNGANGAECGGNGEDGTDGAPGGDGGAGGNGGDIAVQVSCDGGTCDDLTALLKTMLHSVGAPGGDGGRGGTGGVGGSGGQGRWPQWHYDENGYAVYDDNGCAAGFGNGASGSNGGPGSHGANGRNGRIRFSVTGAGAIALALPPGDPPPKVPTQTETLKLIQTQLEQGIASQQGLITACRRTYGEQDGTVTARVTLDEIGSITDVQVAGEGTSLAVCLKRVLNSLSTPPFAKGRATVAVQLPPIE